MPELPEVETIKQQLLSYLPFKIKQVECSLVLKPGIWKYTQHDPLIVLKGQTITDIDRYGKQLIFTSDKGHYLICGLGMSGSWRIKPSGVATRDSVPHTHILFKNQEGDSLFYVDPRRFGKIYFYKNKEDKDAHLKSRLGLDVSKAHLKVKEIEALLLRYPNRPLKRTLLDQSLFAGVGNYLACEICAHAGIHPLRLCKDLNENDFKMILSGIKLSLSKSLKNGGATFHGGYQDAYGDKGEGLKTLVVFYQKVCGLCKKRKVEKIYLDGRGTYFCPSCQS